MFIANQFHEKRVDGKNDCRNWDLMALITVKADKYQEKKQENICLALLHSEFAWNQCK